MLQFLKYSPRRFSGKELRIASGYPPIRSQLRGVSDSQHRQPFPWCRPCCPPEMVALSYRQPCSGLGPPEQNSPLIRLRANSRLSCRTARPALRAKRCGHLAPRWHATGSFSFSQVNGTEPKRTINQRDDGEFSLPKTSAFLHSAIFPHRSINPDSNSATRNKKSNP
jgi:hypothetical protein